MFTLCLLENAYRTVFQCREGDADSQLIAEAGEQRWPLVVDCYVVVEVSDGHPGVGVRLQGHDLVEQDPK